MDISEDRACYDTPEQREVLLALLECPSLADGCFLTGGTALAVWYLHHRTSNDLDFFSVSPIDFHDISTFIQARWPGACRKIKESGMFLSYVVQQTKIDIVHDPLSFADEKIPWRFPDGRLLSLDTVNNIASNKLTALISRAEAKDAVDFYLLHNGQTDEQLQTVISDAQKKDAIFDDPATAAFQLEENITLALASPGTFPHMLKSVALNDMRSFYDHLAQLLYSLQPPPLQ